MHYIYVTNDLTSKTNASHLYAKTIARSGSATMLNSFRELRTFSADVGGQDKLTIVGHGDVGDNGGKTITGILIEALAGAIMSTTLSGVSKIVLFVCSGADSTNLLATNFAREIHEIGYRGTVVGYTGLATFDITGENRYVKVWMPDKDPDMARMGIGSYKDPQKVKDNRDELRIEISAPPA